MIANLGEDISILLDKFKLKEGDKRKINFPKLEKEDIYNFSKLKKRKYKLLSFHDNYRPSYFGLKKLYIIVFFY